MNQTHDLSLQTTENSPRQSFFATPKIASARPAPRRNNLHNRSEKQWRFSFASYILCLLQKLVSKYRPILANIPCSNGAVLAHTDAAVDSFFQREKNIFRLYALADQLLGDERIHRFRPADKNQSVFQQRALLYQVGNKTFFIIKLRQCFFLENYFQIMLFLDFFQLGRKHQHLLRAATD